MPSMNSLDLSLNDIVIKADEQIILEIPSLYVTKGEKIGIKGASGAGKSTLLHLISGLIVPSSGSVRWNNIELSKLSESKRDEFRKENIGLIFQNFFLFEELSAFENVAVSSLFSSKEKRVEIEENAKRYLEYFKIKDIYKREISTYSGGERQRVAVARALCPNPEIIIADEPTASLDVKNANILIEDLIDLSNKQNKTLIVVSHDIELLSKMDKVLTIENGKLKVSL